MWRPSEGYKYCWNVEDAPDAPKGGRLSDRHYRSSEWWVKDVRMKSLIILGTNITPDMLR